MAAILLDGPGGAGIRSWSFTRDKDGHREYKVVRQVKVTDRDDGLLTVALCPGLARVGQPWVVGNEFDLWAWCRPDMEVKPRYDNEGFCDTYDVTQTFSTRPVDRDPRELDPNRGEQKEDPLLEPVKISGGFVKRQEEALYDRFGVRITSSSHEQLRGPHVEFERNSPSLKFEQNVAVLDLALCAQMVDTVNVAPVWGLPRRCWRMTNFSWERKFQGDSYVYYTRSFEFEGRYETWDRDVLDEGTKVLNGRFDSLTGRYVTTKIGGQDPNPDNPLHFMRAQGPDGNSMKLILNGRGLPADLMINGYWYVRAVRATGKKQVIQQGPSDTKTLAAGIFNSGDIVFPQVASRGTGYMVGDLVKLQGGTVLADTDKAVLQVVALQADQATGSTADGFVSALNVYKPGAYLTPPSPNNVATDFVARRATGDDGRPLGSSGTGLQVSLSFAQSAGGVTTAGSRHVEKYDEADFTQLGLPLRWE